MALEFNLCEIILIMMILGPKMLWNSLRSGSLKRRIKRRLQWIFSPILEYHERITPVSWTPRFRRQLSPPTPSALEQGVARRRGAAGQVIMHMHMQTQSGFFGLPIEVREMIYTGVLCVPSLHLHKEDGITKVHGGLCTGRPIIRNYWEGYDRAPDNYILRCLHMVDPRFYQPEPSHSGIRLLRVCWRM
jgi:hypothetical protein